MVGLLVPCDDVLLGLGSVISDIVRIHNGVQVLPTEGSFGPFGSKRHTQLPTNFTEDVASLSLLALPVTGLGEFVHP